MSNENFKPYVFWREECDLCTRRGKCEYEADVRDYKERLDAVPGKGCYGSLSFKCDYFQCDEDEYYSKYPPECAG